VQKVAAIDDANFDSYKDVIFGLSYVATQNEISSVEMIPVKNVNANYIAVIPFAIGTKGHPSLRFDDNHQWWGETVVGVKKTILLAREQGQRIMIKPQIWFRGGSYSGDFELNTEKDWEIFESNYRDYIIKFVKVAVETKAEMFCIGTELETFIEKRPEFWRDLIAEVRIDYKGTLTYAANWDAYQRTWIWEDLDLIGVDAYFPLSNERLVTKDSLAIGWEPWLDELERVSRKFGKKVFFAECGYRSIEFAGMRPWESDNNNRVAHLENQKILYQSMFEEAWSKPWILGGFIWKWFPNHEDTGGENHLGYTPQNKPAEEELKLQYSGGHSLD